MKKIIENNLFMLKYIFRYCPKQVVITCGYSIVSVTNTLISVFMTGYVLDAISQKKSIYKIFFVISVILVLGILSSLFSSYISNYSTPRNTKKLHGEMQKELLNRAAMLSFEYYDDPDFYNNFSIAISQADSRAWGVLQSFSVLISTSVNTIGLVSILGSINPLLILLTIACVGLSMMNQYFSLKLSYQYAMDSVPPQRVIDYIRRVFYQREYAQEIRYNPQVYEIFNNRFENAIKKFYCLIKMYAPKLFALQFTREVISIVLKGVSLVYLICEVYIDKITIGQYAASSSGCAKLYSELNALFDALFQFYNHSLYIDNYKVFMNYNIPEKNNGGLKFPNNSYCLSFSNVEFYYSDKSNPALSAISFSIYSGEKVAIVGENGSGKSTIIKLITQLYVPQKGVIMLNKINLEEYDQDEYRTKIGVISQEYQVFALTIAENVLMRPFCNSKEDTEVVYNALEMVGLLEKVESLPDGIMTPLTKEFSKQGTLLSGGEIQRLIVARAFAKKCKLLVLDEPTSSLDTVSSHSFMDMIFNLSDNMTVLLVTHKLCNLKKADRILVLEQGQIVESGTHDELISEKGKYYRMLEAEM